MGGSGTGGEGAGPRRVAVIIPTYNEAGNVLRVLGEVLEAMNRAGLDGTVTVVDDSSPDGTAELVRQLMSTERRVRLIVRPAKSGIGSAYLEGFRRALEEDESVRVLVEMDADGSHDPKDLPRLVMPVLSGEADVAIGSRYVEGGGWEGGQGLREIVSRGANLLARLCTGVRVRDATSGYRAISSSLLLRVLSGIPPSTKGYVFQVETLAAYFRAGARIVEVPIRFRPRLSGKSKLGPKDVLTFAIWNLRYLIRRLLRLT
ncbi:MAG: polyprenol monophosphomannose synthase [Nitrososphaerota archaeon]